MITLYMLQKNNPVIISEGAFSTETGVLTLEISLGAYSLTGKIITAVFSQTAVETAPLTVSNGLIQLPITLGLLVAGENRIQLNIREGLTLEQSPIMKWTVGLAVSGNNPAPMMNQPQANVINYGAKGDGVTDDTLAIQAAADSFTSSDNYLSDSRGGQLYFPPGKYRKTATILLKPGTSIEGASKDSTLIFDDGVNDDSFMVVEAGTYSAYNMSVRNIKFICSVGSTAGAAINIGYNFVGYGATACLIENVNIYRYFNGISIGNSILFKTSTLLIQSCVNDGIVSSGSANILSITNTYISQCGGHGYNINSCNYSAFLNCGCDSNAGDAYHFDRMTNSTLVSCGAESNGGIALYVNDGGSIVAQDCYFNPSLGDIVYLNDIQGITFINCDGLSATGGKYSINNNGTTRHVKLIGGYFSAPLGFKDPSVFIGIGYGNVNTNSISIGSTASSSLLYLAAKASDDENIIKIDKAGAGTFYISISTAGEFKIKTGVNSAFIITGDAIANSLQLSSVGLTALNGVILRSPNATYYKIVVDNSGVLSTVTL